MAASRTLGRCADAQVALGAGSIIVGLLLIFAPRTGFFDSYNATVATAFWSTAALTEPAMEMSHWLLATCGAGVVGWGVAWVAISHIPFRAGERWAWSCLLASLLVWGVLDLGIAIWFGVTGEVIFVTATLVLALTPLVVSRSAVWTRNND
ncbi:MAG: hypothetical protein AAGI88_20925 [Pseudomonadota bacterium]